VAAYSVHQVVGAEKLDTLRFGLKEAYEREAEDDENRDKDRGQGEIEGVAAYGAPGVHVRLRFVV